uniref:Uncharacterized protein n=1 Tax=Rangifer tarandus platyrhynchus TaxID=3082113 RepID=A0ACB0EDN5_RANTA|nr:unnamed protein product [Rangifer tarandus platyrhynchus]
MIEQQSPLQPLLSAAYSPPTDSSERRHVVCCKRHVARKKPDNRGAQGSSSPPLSQAGRGRGGRGPRRSRPTGLGRPRAADGARRAAARGPAAGAELGAWRLPPPPAHARRLPTDPATRPLRPARSPGTAAVAPAPGSAQPTARRVRGRAGRSNWVSALGPATPVETGGRLLRRWRKPTSVLGWPSQRRCNEPPLTVFDTVPQDPGAAVLRDGFRGVEPNCARS